VGESAALFGRGLLRHFLYWVPGVFLGLLELVQREIGKPVVVPNWLFWLVFGLGVLLAAFLAFHELRQSSREASGDGPDPRYEALSDLLGKSLEVGLELSREGDWPLREAWKAHTRKLVADAYGEGEAAHAFTPELGEARVYRGIDMMKAPPPLAESVNRVRELLGRMPNLTIRPEFNPAEWEPFDPARYKANHALPCGEGRDERYWKCPWCGEEAGLLADCEGCGAERVSVEEIAYRVASS
jgi:hypothetical protein